MCAASGFLAETGKRRIPAGTSGGFALLKVTPNGDGKLLKKQR
jgi:hypothetical protein